MKDGSAILTAWSSRIRTRRWRRRRSLRLSELLTAAGQPAKAAALRRLLEMAGAPEGMKMLARRGLAACSSRAATWRGRIVQYKALAAAKKPRRKTSRAFRDIGRCYEGASFKGPGEREATSTRQAIAAVPESQRADPARFRVESLRARPDAAGDAAPGAGPAPGAAAAATRSAPATTISALAATASKPATTASMPQATPSAAATSSPEPAASMPAAAATST